MTEDKLGKAVELNNKLNTLAVTIEPLGTLPIIVYVGDKSIRLDNESTDEVEINVYSAIKDILNSYYTSVQQQFEEL